MPKHHPQSLWCLSAVVLTMAHLLAGCGVDSRTALETQQDASRGVVSRCPAGQIAGAEVDGKVPCAKHLGNPVKEGVSQDVVVAEVRENSRTASPSGVTTSALDNLPSRVISGYPLWRCVELGQRAANLVGTYWSYAGGPYTLYEAPGMYCAQYGNNEAKDKFYAVNNNGDFCADSADPNENSSIGYTQPYGVKNSYRRNGRCPARTAALQAPVGLQLILLASNGNTRTIRLSFSQEASATWYRVDRLVPGVGYVFQTWLQAPNTTYDLNVPAGTVALQVYSWNSQVGNSPTATSISRSF